MQIHRAGTFFISVSIVAFGLMGTTVWAQTGGGEGGASGAEESPEESGVDVREELNRANRLAGRGALTRSVPHYEKVLRAAAAEHPSAHYNFAEVLKAKEEFGRALLHYQAYLLMGEEAGTKTKAESRIETLKARVWDKRLAKLSVDVEPEAQATLKIDGFPVVRNRDLENFELVSGKFEVSAAVVDHEPISKRVELEHEGNESIELRPKKKTFYGKLRVEVDRDGAQVEVEPEELDAPREPNEGASATSPVESAFELETGKWLVEVTKEGFHKWVRYVEVKRDREKRVDVELQKKLPEEIR